MESNNLVWTRGKFCNENGPNKPTIIPPPRIIKIHIPNKKP